MGIRNWKFNKTVNNVLKDCKLTPYGAMTQAKSKMVCHIHMMNVFVLT